MKKIVLTSLVALIGYLGYGQSKIDSAQKATQQSKTAFRVSFETVFKTNTDGSISPKYQTQVGGVIMGPGVAMNNGVSMGGFDVQMYRGHDLSIDTLKGVVIIRGVYR